jgi:hypothetical protein
LHTAASKPARGINFRIWEKMLHTVDKAASSSDGQVLANPTYQDDAACPFHSVIPEKLLFWTRVSCNLSRVV